MLGKHMKKIKMTSYTALSLIFSILSTGSYTLAAPSLLGFTIQFSKNSTLVPMHINQAGNQITITKHETAQPKITFEVPKDTEVSHVDVIITPATIEFELKKFPNEKEIYNTIDYLKIDPQSAYKYYSLDFIDGAWDIKEETLAETGRLPDRALIIECYPDWITDFKGGSSLELPTLYVTNALNDLGSTEEDFQESLVKLELAALDSKIVHAPIRRKTQAISDKKRVLIMDLIA